MKMRRLNTVGNSLVEFTLVGIPLIFILLGTFEMARGMWLYATVAHAVREGARYAAVHGKDCSTPPNQCAATVAAVAAVIRDAGVGLEPTDFYLAMTASAPRTTSNVTLTPLSSLLTDSSTFLSGTTGVAGNDVIVTGVYHFHTALTAFFPGPPTPPPPPAPLGGSDDGALRLAATSRERIEF